MKNNDLIQLFLNGATKGAGSNLYIFNNKLINYDTIIAYRLNDNIILINGQNYSKTTTKHQNKLKQSNKIIREYYDYNDFKKEIQQYDEHIA